MCLKIVITPLNSGSKLRDGSNYFLGLSQHIFVNSIEIKNKSDIIGRFNYHFVSAAFILNESKLSCHCSDSNIEAPSETFVFRPF